MNIGDKVETPNGIGVIEDFRPDGSWVRVRYGNGPSDISWYLASECIFLNDKDNDRYTDTE